MWIVMKDRLITSGRLLNWGYKGDVQCRLCHNQLENRDHLFFECSFSYRIWKFCMIRHRVDNPLLIWDDILLLRCRNWGHKTLKCMLCRLVLGSVVYNLWRTRNGLKHAGQPSTEEQPSKKILWKVRTRIVRKGRFPKTRKNLVLCSLWNLPAELLL